MSMYKYKSEEKEKNNYLKMRNKILQIEAHTYKNAFLSD